MVKPPQSQVFNPEQLPFFERKVPLYSFDNQSFYQFAVEVAADEVFLMNSHSQIIYVNHSACKQLGYRREELIGKHVWDWDPIFTKEMWDLFWIDFTQNKHLHFETQHRKKNGDVFPAEIHAHLYVDHGEFFLLAFVNDLTEKKKAEELIHKQANYDQLTGLPNRYLLMDRLQHALSSAERDKHQVALLFMDLDKFKAVNDTYGHPIGDKLLIEAASRITLNIRDADTVARLGGDEFVVIIERATMTDVQTISEKLCTVFEAPFQIEQHQMKITTSIGVAFYPEDGTSTYDLIRIADRSMYRAKSLGCNQYFIAEN